MLLNSQLQNKSINYHDMRTPRNSPSQVFLTQVKDVAYAQATCVDIFTRIKLTYIYKPVSYRILFLGFALFSHFVVGVFSSGGMDGCVSFLPLMLNKSICSIPKLLPSHSLITEKSLGKEQNCCWKTVPDTVVWSARESGTTSILHQQVNQFYFAIKLNSII